MRRFVSRSLVAAALLVAGPALAADKTDQLVAALKVDEALESAFSSLAPLFGTQVLAELERQPGTRDMVSELAAKGRGGRERMQEILAEEFLVELRKSYPHFNAQIAEAYRARLSDAELDAALQFFSGSAGAKFLSIQADFESTMKSEGEKIGAKAAMAAVPRAFERIEAENAQ